MMPYDGGVVQADPQKTEGTDGPDEAIVIAEEQSTDEWLAAYEAAEVKGEAERAQRAEAAAKAAARRDDKRQERSGGKIALVAADGRRVISDEEAFDPITSEALGRLLLKAKENDYYEVRWLDREHEDYPLFVKIGLGKWRGVFAHRYIEKPVRTRNGLEKRMEMGEIEIMTTPLRVKRLIKDVANSSHRAIELEWLPSGETEWCSGIFWLDDLLNTDKRSEVWRELSRQGLRLEKLHEIQRMIGIAADIGVEEGAVDISHGSTRAGWHGDEFVAVGYRTEKAPEFIGLAANAAGAWNRMGAKEQYLKAMSEVLEANPHVGLVCGYFAAGALVSRVKSENFMLGMIGRSSTGKTLCIRTALSMRGKPSDFATFDGTGNALKTMMLAGNDQAIVIDEVGQNGMRDDEKIRFIYSVSQGKTRLRSKRASDGDYQNNDQKTANYSVIFTGEEEFLSSIKNAPAGARVRCTTLYFDPQAGKPLWNTIKDAAGAEAWSAFIDEHHGYLMPLVVDKMREIGASELRRRYDEMLAWLREHAEKHGADDLAKRQLKLFACAVLGARVLAEVLGFDPTGIEEAAFDHAAALGTGASERGDESVHFENALRATTTNPDHFFMPATDPLAGRTVPRKSTWGEVKKMEPQLEVVILASQMDAFCQSAGIDRFRFEQYAKDHGWMKVSHSGGKTRYVDRRRVGGSIPQNAYAFVLQVEAEPQPGQSVVHADDPQYGEHIPF